MMESCLVLLLVFCLVISFGIRTVVGISQYVLQHNLWFWTGQDFLNAAFIWKLCFSIWDMLFHPSKLSSPSVKPSLTILCPSFLSSHKHNCVRVSTKS